MIRWLGERKLWDLVGTIRSQFPGLEGQVGEPEGGEAEDAEVHRLERFGKVMVVVVMVR